MDIDYIIIQAGGRGSRMQSLTQNKPKALVPIDNRPMIFHIFEQFPQKRFIVIADYKSDVLKKYLAAFAKVKYLVVEPEGEKGTCAGIEKALKAVPSNAPFALIWCDLVLKGDFHFPQREGSYVALSGSFPCRWKFENGALEESPSEQFGVAGLFVFSDKKFLEGVPKEGEFVRWLKDSNKALTPFTLEGTKEYGLYQAWEREKGALSKRCRPFNKITEKGGLLIKEGIDEQGKSLAEKEVKWYRYVKSFSFSRIPEIYAFEPLIMQRIEGKNVFEYDLTLAQKREVLQEIVRALRKMHSFGEREADYFGVHEAYEGKTFKRLEKIRDLVPFADEKYILVNGKRCRNIFFFKEELEKKLSAYTVEKFTFIHGDNTFSNILLDKDLKPVFIDPRGYFGYSELFGDPNYDWAKLYYSIAGNYDKFNLKKFRLEILEDGVNLSVESNGWEDLAGEFCEMVASEIDEETLKLLHAVIWLSLTTYAWEDYDSILGAFYRGVYLLEDVL